jgi:alkylated DNA repair protein alkB family protein 8
VQGEAALSDYLVPWHLPTHRPAGAVAAAALAARGRGSGSTANTAPAAPAAGGGVEQAAAAPWLDGAKRAVVFQRYYHLFGAGELEALVEGLPGVRLISSCYDRSNWCVTFERL